jgi:TatD DNase family protein
VGRLTDTHCHLNLNTFQEDLPDVLARAQAAGVERILVPGIDVPSSQLAVELAERYPMVYAAVGVHPSEANSWDEHSASSLRELAKNSKVMAIGEIGLDYYRDHAPRELQRQIFHKQLEIAAELELPVSVHNRSSTEDVWAELGAWQAGLRARGVGLAAQPGVLHSFDGTLGEAQAMIEIGFFLGISGPVTFSNARQRQQLAAQLPLSALLIETDAPYLTPQPYRGRRNEPAYTHFIVEKLAALHQLAYSVIVQETFSNAARLFAWGAEI